MHYSAASGVALFAVSAETVAGVVWIGAVVAAAAIAAAAAAAVAAVVAVVAATVVVPGVSALAPDATDCSVLPAQVCSAAEVGEAWPHCSADPMGCWRGQRQMQSRRRCWCCPRHPHTCSAAVTAVTAVTDVAAVTAVVEAVTAVVPVARTLR